MTSKHNIIYHHYIYYQDIVCNDVFVGSCVLQTGHLDEILGYFGGQF